MPFLAVCENTERGLIMGLITIRGDLPRIFCLMLGGQELIDNGFLKKGFSKLCLYVNSLLLSLENKEERTKQRNGECKGRSNEKNLF